MEKMLCKYFENGSMKFNNIKIASTRIRCDSYGEVNHETRLDKE